MLDEVNAQHALQADRRSAAHTLGVVRPDHITQLRPRHDRIHRRQELVASRGLAVALEARTLIGRRCKGLLLHECSTHEVIRRGPFSANP